MRDRRALSPEQSGAVAVGSAGGAGPGLPTHAADAAPRGGPPPGPPPLRGPCSPPSNPPTPPPPLPPPPPPPRKNPPDPKKQTGPVTEPSPLNRHDKYDELMSEYAGRAAIGHV